MEKIVEGKLDSYFEQVVLVDQKSIRDPAVKISQLIAEATAKMGENITVSTLRPIQDRRSARVVGVESSQRQSVESWSRESLSGVLVKDSTTLTDSGPTPRL